MNIIQGIAIVLLTIFVSHTELLALGVGDMIPKITTKDGKTYHQVVVKRILPDGITVFHKDGVATIPASVLPESLASGLTKSNAATKKTANTTGAGSIPSDAAQAPTNAMDKVLRLFGTARAVQMSIGDGRSMSVDQLGAMFALGSEKARMNEPIADWLLKIQKDTVLVVGVTTVSVQIPVAIDKVRSMIGVAKSVSTETGNANETSSAGTDRVYTSRHTTTGAYDDDIGRPAGQVEIAWHNYGKFHFGVVEGKVHMVRVDHL